jgi:hypothetical protein
MMLLEYELIAAQTSAAGQKMFERKAAIMEKTENILRFACLERIAAYPIYDVMPCGHASYGFFGIMTPGMERLATANVDDRPWPPEIGQGREKNQPAQSMRQAIVCAFYPDP